jgi:hypothetical protein
MVRVDPADDNVTVELSVGQGSVSKHVSKIDMFKVDIIKVIGSLKVKYTYAMVGTGGPAAENEMVGSAKLDAGTTSVFGPCERNSNAADAAFATPVADSASPSGNVMVWQLYGSRIGATVKTVLFSLSASPSAKVLEGSVLIMSS